MVKENAKVLGKVLKDLPKAYEIKTGHDTYNFEFSPEDIADAKTMVENSGTLKKKGLDSKEVKENVALFLKTKRLEDIISEVEAVAVKRTIEKMQRGEKGVEVVREKSPSALAAQEAFNKKMGIAYQ